jgi:hypothetical protein
MTQVISTDDRGAVAVRAIGWGAGCGAVAGAIVGSFIFPILGTAVGAAVGALVGLVFGVLNGLALTAIGPEASHWSARVVAGGVSAACGLGMFAVLPRHVVVDLGFAAACGVIGVLVGPAARFGLVREGRAAVSLVGRGLGFGMAAGGLIGAVAGLVIGLFSYAPTAFAAVLEGGVLGALTGAALGLLGAAVVVIATSRIR